MKKSTINILLYSIMGVLFLTICILLVKIANRPRYVAPAEPVREIQEITFDVSSGTTANDEASDLNQNNEDDTKEAATDNEVKIQCGKTSTKVNIREQADSESRLLETVEEGYTFEILEIMDSGWVKISYGDGIAYISSKYVILINN